MNARAGLGVRALLAGVALLLVAVPFGLLLFFVEDRWAPLREADAGARDGMHGYAVRSAALVRAMQVVSSLGGTVAWTVVAVVVTSYLLYRGLRRIALFVVLALAGSSLLNGAVKMLVHRSRPVLPDPVAHATGLSFPSGHAQASVVGYSVLLLVFLPVLHGVWRRVAISVAVVMVLLTGLARITLGVHYLSDVLAGYLLGAAWVLAMTAAFSAWRQDRGRAAVQPSQGLAPEDADRLFPGTGA